MEFLFVHGRINLSIYKNKKQIVIASIYPYYSLLIIFDYYWRCKREERYKGIVEEVMKGLIKFNINVFKMIFIQEVVSFLMIKHQNS